MTRSRAICGQTTQTSCSVSVLDLHGGVRVTNSTKHGDDSLGGHLLTCEVTRRAMRGAKSAKRDSYGTVATGGFCRAKRPLSNHFSSGSLSRHEAWNSPPA